MTMWSTEWMFLYVLAILVGNIAVIAYASHANRRSSERNGPDNSERPQDLSSESSRPTN